MIPVLVPLIHLIAYILSLLAEVFHRIPCFLKEINYLRKQRIA